MGTLVAATIPSLPELAVIFILMVATAVAPILIVLWFVRKTLENKKENVRLRLEVGKLADELEQLRKQQRTE